MQSKTEPAFFTLLLMISFASVNAVLFTPSLPNIVTFFDITENTAQYTITLFLIGYAFGQLIYGPISNRFGRKCALYSGVILQIASSLLCAFAGMIHIFQLLILGRFLLALGSGVGLKMTYTLVNECYEPKVASQKISYLVLAFAITPGLSVALGGFLNEHFGWTTCFYAGALYGVILLFLLFRLPETQSSLDINALKLKHLLHGYSVPFKNSKLLAGGFLMGICTSFVYVFAAAAPFIAINLLGMNSVEFGTANIVPPIGLILGSFCSATLVKKIPMHAIMKTGIVITSIGALLMIVAVLMHLPALFSLFLPMIVIYFGLSFVIANASTLAMSQIEDKAHASAVMNFLNMGMATVVVITLGFFSMNATILPFMYIILSATMIGLYRWIRN